MGYTKLFVVFFTTITQGITNVKRPLQHSNRKVIGLNIHGAATQQLSSAIHCCSELLHLHQHGYLVHISSAVFTIYLPKYCEFPIAFLIWIKMRHILYLADG